MKKIIFLLTLIGLSMSVQAKNKYDPVCEVSGFDNQTTCSVRTYGVVVDNKPTILSHVAFGGIWTSADPENIAVVISLGDIVATIQSISFNVDGEISTLKIPVEASKIIRDGNLKKTTSMVIIPRDYLEKMLAAKDLKYRVTTISNGYREGSFYTKTSETEPVKTLKALLERSTQQSKN